MNTATQSPLDEMLSEMRARNAATREATVAEIAERFKWQISEGKRVRFCHFLKEIYMPHAKHSVAHVEYSMAKLRSVDGKLFVNHQGQLQEVTATIIDRDTKIVYDLRIKSEYLK